MQYEFPFQDELDKLSTLLSQNQFELLVQNTAVASQQNSDIRLVQDAVLLQRRSALSGLW